ncbi:cation transporter [Flammeovirga sp. EKP202]|uniref:cation transporter n=1 Tax=Flammeovirga sp. EKP202 TaxID=2770592 RepID=UPI00165F1433|nr:cation transporter [Flammeovirga sp. EKP202]MBD0403273.1 cation transporter [Flammeovirga sp. EKP202]
MEKTIFKINQMDCPSEETLIRMKLEEFSSIKNLSFDIPNRQLTIYHQGHLNSIEKAILDLKLGGHQLNTEVINEMTFDESSNQRKLLWWVLIINFTFFLIEMSTGFISNSMGLVADSLDMLADAFVYGISLLAVGGTMAKKKRIAVISGYFQITLAIIGFIEVLRRFLLNEQIPDFTLMILISLFALMANGLCLYLLQKSKNKEEAHMKASMIFTSNDIIINTGVIVAGILVNWLESNKPDLIIGSIVFLLVVQGALRILKLGK